MWRTDSPLSEEIPGRRAFIVALAAAGICLFLIRSSVFAFFFLVPLGFTAFRYNCKTAWAACILAVMGDVVLTMGTVISQGIPLAETIWNLLYFAGMVGIFTWINVPTPFLSGLSVSARLMAGSCVGALLFTVVFFRLLSSPSFSEYAEYLLNALLSMYRSSGSDVVLNARLEMLNAEAVLRLVKSLMLRGGSMISCTAVFSICRQLSFFLAGLFRRKDAQNAYSALINSLVNFHVSPALIWVFSSSLFLVVLARIAKLEIPEIIIWNILVLCVILYFAQGLGILQFLLTRMSPFLRMLLSVVLILLLFGPLLNAFLLGGLILLGIAENWAPFRSPKKNEPPSTPEAGDG